MSEHPTVYVTGRSYEEVRRRGREGADDGVKHHRLLAFAWEMIDSLDERREIDHRLEGCEWLNIESNLRPKDEDEHQRRTRRRARQRRLNPDQWEQTAMEVIA